jgi:thiamine biosynthesis lipoprotein
VSVFGGTDGDIDAAFSRIRDLDNLLSDYKPDSQISQINRSSGKAPVEVGDKVKEVLQTALRVAEETNGAFDPTIGALTIGLYHFGMENVRVPTDEEIDKAKTLVNYRWVRIDGNRVFLEKEGMMLDLGGVGKGFAVDKAVEAIAAFKTGGRDLAVSTIGDYDGYIEKDGKVYHHVLNPKSGKPAGDFRSITVIMEGNNTLAHAYAASLYVMDKERALEFLGRHPEIGAFMVFSNGEIYYNDRFKRLVGFKN